jgi:hypothetical protein
MTNRKSKIRHTCIFCGAKKYEEYMSRKTRKGNEDFKYWECKNQDKCVKRMVNYGK